MQPQVYSELRKLGIDFLDHIPSGTHLCGFYKSEQDHAEMVMSFFQAGLTNKEYCLWIADDICSSLRDTASLKGIEVISFTDWYSLSHPDRQDGLVEHWRSLIDGALSQGYSGVRIVHCHEGVFPHERGLNLTRETLFHNLTKGRPVVALCPYPLHECNLPDILELSSSHSFAFFRAADSQDEAYKAINRHNVVRRTTAEVVHEIRNPMTSIKALMQLFHTKPEFVAYTDIIDKVIDEVERAEQLAHQFLSVARTHVSSHGKGCNLNSTLDALLPLLKATAAKMGQRIYTELTQIPDIPCQAGEMRQIILNLAQNSFEAMSSGGVLFIGTAYNSPYVVLTIKDTGPGIPPEHLENLTVPFFTTKCNGTGLGLPVTHRILQKYRAKMDIDSTKKGTTITIRFPSCCLNMAKGPH